MYHQENNLTFLLHLAGLIMLIAIKGCQNGFKTVLIVYFKIISSYATLKAAL